jgi:hypothetical protein
VANAAQHLDLISLELHTSTPPIPQPTAGKLSGYLGLGDLDIGNKPFEHGNEGRPV